MCDWYAEVLMLRARVKELEAEREAEIEGALSLRQEFGARPDEAWGDFLRRIVSDYKGAGR